MKITIEKSHFTMAEAPEVRARLEEMKEYLIDDEIKHIARFYTNNGIVRGVYDVKASISKHVGGLYESSDNYDGMIDCWVEMLVECDDAVYRVGFYVLDFWCVVCNGGYDNRDEVRSRAYIRKFVCN